MLAFKKPGTIVPQDQIAKPPTDLAVSPLLAFIAGDFAADVAVVWPAPHTRFLTASAARRHLVCLALTAASKADVTPGLGVVADALEKPFKKALRDLLPDAPDGVFRALGHLGEQAWAPADYLALLDLLRRPTTAKVLRHAEAISPGWVRVLAALPDEMVQAGGELLRLTRDQTVLLAEAFAAIARRDGLVRAKALARRWADARNVHALFRQARSDMHPMANEPAQPPAVRLVALATQEAMADAARRHRNCLESRFLDEANHYYEWRGKPGAVICVTRDPLFGWRLDEAKAAGNEAVPPEAKAEIVATLRTMGVHVGRSAWCMDYQLQRAADPDFSILTEERAIAVLFDD